MNPIAEELNEVIATANPAVFDMLSELGKQIYFPKGILSQGAEAKQKGKKFNATIGIATEEGVAMHFKCMKKYLPSLEVDDAFTYAPSFGLPALRQRWQQKIKDDTPSLGDKPISLPVVTNALTHGLSVAADMFINPGDLIVLPDKIWGNYNLIFKVRKKAEFLQFPFFDGKGLNVKGLENTLKEASEKRNKIILLLNFPNNPTGYSITKKEAEQLAVTIARIADTGTKIVLLIDDAYYGLFYEEKNLKESIFGKLGGIQENVLAVKIDGATKEHYVWGFRVGFLTYAAKSEDQEALYEALAKKTAGIIRGNISNCSKLSQSLVLNLLNEPDLAQEKEEKFNLLKARALKVKEVLKNDKYDEVWGAYPFNSGYFMCLKLKEADPEKVRLHLLEKYETGIIAVNKTDIRIAFSCLEEKDIEEVFEILYKAVKEMAE